MEPPAAAAVVVVPAGTLGTRETTDPRIVTARRIFVWAVIFYGALTALWAVSMLTGHGTRFFGTYTVDAAALGRVGGAIVFFYVIWGLIWWGVKSALLRLIGFTKEERRDAFSSRMDRPYDVSALTDRYSARKIRIVDMIGRRGRFITMQAPAFHFLYQQIKGEQNANFATMFLGDSLFDAVAIGWIFLLVYRLNGFIGATFYGPQSRVMDGMLARANCLLITTLWGAFKFVMVPLGGMLAAIYPKQEFAAVFALIWVSYMAADACSEIFGSLFGRQSIKVWGIGDVNRKSLVGVVAGFLGALATNLLVVTSQGLGPAWIALAFVIALSSTLVELYSPRATDDFTMATSNALICLAFGIWIH